ncbi:uncharacterized protein LOC118349199 [Juglans regia]|uniref:Uncharacterized protein LOC118349199 n=1 Tax=Juglans regia TaxID=51240 RepID=A0A6P9EJS6_JUGRE|nr:uncharacterized protein LOC118349199 [Juglans regia]
MSTRRLRPYFQAHPIKVITSTPLQKVLQKPDTLGQLVKWSIKLSKYDISYVPRTAVKGQILVDFVTKLTNFLKETPKAPEKESWLVQVDGSSCRGGGGVGVHMIADNDMESFHAILLNFKVRNNEAEYEVNEQIPREDNWKVDRLARATSTRQEQMLPWEVTLRTVDTTAIGEEIFEIEGNSTGWANNIIRYLKVGELPTSQEEARKEEGHWWQKYESRLLSDQRPVGLKGVHKRVCPVPTTRTNLEHAPEELKSRMAPWSFAQRGIDLVSLMPPSKGGTKFIIVVVDYFTKWAEAEAMAMVTAQSVTRFTWKAINSGSKSSIRLPDTHRQNKQLEATNKTIMGILKNKVGEKKGVWADELPKILWAYKTTPNTSIGETPFSLAYKTEAMIQVEVGIPRHKKLNFDVDENGRKLEEHLNLLEEE